MRTKFFRDAFLLLAIVSLLMFPQVGSAQRFPTFRNVGEVVERVLCPVALYMFGILIVLAVIFVLYAGFLFLTSQGDPNKVSTATKTLTYTAVAVVVALLARGFPFIIASFFGASLGTATCR